MTRDGFQELTDRYGDDWQGFNGRRPEKSDVSVDAIAMRRYVMDQTILERRPFLARFIMGTLREVLGLVEFSVGRLLQGLGVRRTSERSVQRGGIRRGGKR